MLVIAMVKKLFSVRSLASGARWPLALGLMLCAAAAGASTEGSLALGKSVCHVMMPDGSSTFLRTNTFKVAEARRNIRDYLARSLGVSQKEASRMIRECIAPGGSFEDPELDKLWRETPL